jgi:predicted ribosomally synthesized peptide with SipW-like signal peptide
MFTKKTKRYLMLLSAVGLLAIAAGGAGTFASFNAEVTNSGNTFTSGTLFLHETPNGGTVCQSEGTVTVSTTGNHNDCTTPLFTYDLSNPAQQATIALNNAGSINAAHVSFKIANCAWSDNFGVTGSHTTFISVPTDCSNVHLTVQETQSDFTTNVFCAFNTNATACPAIGSATSTLDDATSLTNLNTTGNTATTLAAGDTSYYVMNVDPVVTGGNDNSLQNLKLTFDVTWHLDQL